MTERQTTMAYGEVFGKPLDSKDGESFETDPIQKEIKEIMESQKKIKIKK